MSIRLAVGLLTPSWRIGTLDALYWIMSGGVIPGGSCLRIVWELAVNCATRAADVRAGLEKHLDDRDTRHRLRFDVLDVID